jgi:hypothetical protein
VRGLLEHLVTGGVSVHVIDGFESIEVEEEDGEESVGASVPSFDCRVESLKQEPAVGKAAELVVQRLGA